MKMFMKLFILLPLLSFSSLSTASNALSKHSGKCGELKGLNMGDNMEQCKVGDVVIVQRKVVPMYCDYRYSIHEYGGKGSTSIYSCILRVLRKDRHK